MKHIKYVLMLKIKANIKISLKTYLLSYNYNIQFKFLIMKRNGGKMRW